MFVRLQAVAFGQGVVSLIPQLQALTEILPPPTLEWKLKLLEEGNRCLSLPRVTPVKVGFRANIRCISQRCE